jgi:hypothetical protein
MSLKTMLLIMVSTFSLYAFAQGTTTSNSTSTTEDPGQGSALDEKMMKYLGLDSQKGLSTDDLIEMCEQKMWTNRWLEKEDSEFLLKSGLLDHLFTEAKIETDLEKKGKKIYRIKGVLEQNMHLNSEQTILQMEYYKKLKDVESAYEIENDKVEPEVLQKNLATYLALPETTPLDELVEKAVLKIVENGIVMDYSAIDVLLNKKLYKYMSRNEKWTVDAVLLGAMVMYNGEVRNVGIGVNNYYLISDVFKKNEKLGVFVKGTGWEKAEESLSELRETMRLSKGTVK